MKILDTEQIRWIDSYTIHNEPIASIDLMERAALSCLHVLTNKFDVRTRIVIYCGMGNNGGDGLALCRLLLGKGYACQAVVLEHTENYSSDCRTNLDRLLNDYPQSVSFLRDPSERISFDDTELVIDAILGSGLNKAITHPLLISLIRQINTSQRTVVSIDIPTGMFAQAVMPLEAVVVQACLTITFQLPKLGFMFIENYPFVGQWTVTDIGLHSSAIAQIRTSYYYIDKQLVRSIFRPRFKFSHKGNFGHGLLIAGSKSMLGAAVLASKAALRGGIGLLTVHVPRVGYSILQTAVPEAICQTDTEEDVFSSIDFKLLTSYNAIAIGCGLGRDERSARGLKKMIGDCGAKMVFDADAIHLLAQNRTWLDFLPDSILTPHPKEFECLVGKCSSSTDALERQRQFSIRYRCVVVRKGAHTCITAPTGDCYFNSTGNSALSTAGSGDVLTGVILALLANGYNCLQSALLGVWLHGRAADEAILDDQSKESTIASDIVEYLGKAFQNIE